MTTQTPTSPNLAEKAEIAEQRLAGLRARRASLALDAVGGDEQAKTDLDRLEADLADAEADLEHLHLAAAEQERREIQAAEEARSAAQQAALDEARRLEVERKALARKVDKAITTLCSHMADYWRACDAQADRLRAADRGQAAQMATPRSWGIEGAIALGLRETGMRGLVLERMGAIPPQHQRPLADWDPVAVKPEQAP